MRPRFAILVVTAAFFLVTPLLRAADVQWPAKIGNWTDVGAAPSGPPEGLPISDSLLHEAGLLNTNHRIYTQGGKKAYLTLLTFHDSSGSYEAWGYISYRVFKDPSNPIIATIYESNQILDIVSNGVFGKDMVDEAARWAKSISDRVARPPIVDYLPTAGRVPAAEYYSLGPVSFRRSLNQDVAKGLAEFIGFTSGAESISCQYKSGNDEATLLLIDYPTPQLAELHMRHLRRALADAKLTSSGVERKGSLLSIVLAPTSQEYAERLRSSVNYETSVTWNEPSSTATDPPIMSTLVKIIVATFVFMGVTLVLGIAFGGVRIITKRIFPGKVFDRKEQIEVLQLGLNSKPIDPSDMY